MKISSKNRRKVIVAGTLFAVTAVPSFAIFGLGDIVFDPSAYAEAIQSVLTARQQFEAMKANLAHFSFKQAWQTSRSAMNQAMVENKQGETTGMTQAINTDSPDDAVTAWKASTVAVDSNTSTYLQGQTAGNSAQLSQLAMIEMSDSTSPACLNAIGKYKGARDNNAQAEADLQQQQLDSGDDTNSEVEQLNLLNASEAQRMVEVESQGVIQACLAAQSTVANMQQRNAAAADLNRASFIQQQRTTTQNNIAGGSHTWTHYIP